MNKEKMSKEEIEKFNANVEFNQSAASWIMDIVCTIIIWPMILLAIHRRIKYKEKIGIETNDSSIEQSITNKL